MIRTHCSFRKIWIFTWSLLFVFPSFGLADTIKLAGKFSENDRSFSEPQSITTSLVRDFLALPLVQKNLLTDSYTPVLASRVQKSSDSTWTITLRRGALCADGTEISKRDVEDSLVRCSSKGTLSPFSFLPQQTADTIRFRTEQSVTQSQLVERLSQCPIYKARMMAAFGSEFGQGTTLIGCGNYQMTNFRAGKSINLTALDENPHHPNILIQSFSRDDIAVLRTLQRGELDGIIEPSEEIREIASKDPTLSVITCSQLRLLARPGIHLECSRFSLIRDS